MNNIIVTGASGMIGATLTNICAKQGINVTAIVRSHSPKINNIIPDSHVNIVECDLSDLCTLPSILCGTYDAFFHFAWNGTYGTARNDVSIQESNIRYYLDAITAASKLGCRTFVGAGSQAEFGNTEETLSDAIPKNPVTGYGIAKYSASLLGKKLCESYGMKHCWGRIVSCYGPYDNSYTLIMSAISALHRGDHMGFTKGEQIWDYIFSEDCAKAFLAIGEKGIHGKAYTIGSGIGRPLRDYISTIQSIVSPDTPVGFGEIDYYPNQVMHLCADISELAKDTGFKPVVSFEEGIKRTYEWYKEVNGLS